MKKEHRKKTFFMKAEGANPYALDFYLDENPVPKFGETVKVKYITKSYNPDNMNPHHTVMESNGIIHCTIVPSANFCGIYGMDEDTRKEIIDWCINNPNHYEAKKLKELNFY